MKEQITALTLSLFGFALQGIVRQTWLKDRVCLMAVIIKVLSPDAENFAGIFDTSYTSIHLLFTGNFY